MVDILGYRKEEGRARGRISQNIQTAIRLSVSWGIRCSFCRRIARPRYRGVPHPCPSCPPSQGTCTEDPLGRSSEGPGNWGSQKGGRNWGRWCSSDAPHSPHLRDCRDIAAGPGRGTLQPSQRRSAVVRGRGGAGSGTLSMPPHRPCAGGHTCH